MIINSFYQNNIKKIDIFSSFLNKTKFFLLNTLNSSFVNLQHDVSINSDVKLILSKKLSDIKINIISNNIKLKRKIFRQIFFEKIDYIRVSMNVIKNNFRSKWIVKKTINCLPKKILSGYFNILDINHENTIEGNFITHNYPVSFINFFTTNLQKVQGIFNGRIKLYGTLYQPKLLANLNFKNIFIKSDNFFKYLTVFFPYFSGKTNFIKINQEIIIKKGNILFTLNPVIQDNKNIQWNLLFRSKKIGLLILPKIIINVSSELNLHYIHKKYDLLGYIKFPFFNFQINEKNFIF